MQVLTATEWLMTQLYENKDVTISCDGGVLDDLLAKAKEIERNQHGNTWDKSLENLQARGGNTVRAYTDFDDHYAETFRS